MSDCDCCGYRKPFVRKAADWYTYSAVGKVPIPPFWYIELDGIPEFGRYVTWEAAMRATLMYRKV